MADHLQHELKKEFQLERMILFSDAVFAIAITLLVIEIKVPAFDRHSATDAMLLKSLDDMIPKFIGFVFSFLIIGAYWIIHHQMFGFVINYNSRLLSINLVLLFAVVLMPFSTAFFSEYLLRFLITPMLFYIINIALLGFMNYFLWRYISNPKNQLSLSITKKDRIYISFRSLIPAISFIVLAIAFLTTNPRIAPYIVIFIVLALRTGRKLIRKKYS